jgi:hypothetical protein
MVVFDSGTEERVVVGDAVVECASDGGDVEVGIGDEGG